MLRPDYDLDAWRRRIPLLATTIPMNNCSQAPQSDITRAAAEQYLDSWKTIGMDWDSWMDEVRLAKAEFASLINASVDEIAVFSSVSEATSAVASTIDFAGGRRKVVVTEAEFPTIGHVWLAQERRGACVTWVPVRDGTIDIASYDSILDDRTAIVSACHGYFVNGFMQDVGTLARRAHDAGALLYVDAYQTAGSVPIDVRALDVDFLAAGTLKFLMGIPGIAFLYVRRELIERMEPLVTGWFGRADPFAFRVNHLDWSATASRFDSGTPPVINAYVARAGLRIINDIGASKIALGSRSWRESSSMVDAPADFDCTAVMTSAGGQRRQPSSSTTLTLSKPRCERAACCLRRADRSSGWRRTSTIRAKTSGSHWTRWLP
jgi:selenocysteine lyase/cysteine desulfurase